MMYPRLRLLREFLREDGVLFVSISDETKFLLDILMREILARRRIGSLVWWTKDSSNDADRNFSAVHEHVVVYAGKKFDFYGTEIGREKYRNPDQDSRGPYSLDPISKAHSYIERENSYYPIQDPKTGWWYPCNPDSVWRYASRTRVKAGAKLRSKTIEELIEDNRIVFSATTCISYATKEELLRAIDEGNVPRDGKGIPLRRPELPDLDFWIGRPIGLGRPSKKAFWLEMEKTTRPVSSMVTGSSGKGGFIRRSRARAGNSFRKFSAR
jgi:adenine-specific DNA-methyltransferase